MVKYTVPETVGLDGLEEKWTRRWREQDLYRFDRSKGRDEIYSIDTPPPTVSGSLHVGHVFSYTHTDILARFHRMCGKEVFYPLGWDDNGLPTERRVQNFYGVRCDPSLPYDTDFTPPEKPASRPADQVPISRRNFVELCHKLTQLDEQAFEELWQRIGLSVDWSMTYATIDDRSRTAAQRAFLRNVARGEAYISEAPTLWDVTFRTAVAQAELEDRETSGAFYEIVFRGHEGQAVHIETTRPELLPACVALVANPDDERYKPLFGTTVRSPIFRVEVPVVAHALADPDKGSGIAMICTFGDLTDVVWWREFRLPTRAIIGKDGRIAESIPSWLDSQAAEHAYEQIAGRTIHGARQRIVELLHERGELVGQARPIKHAVKFYEKGDRPLEIVTTRQWYLKNGGRDEDLRRALIERGYQLNWHPKHMRARFENWVEGLNGDWLVSRQRFFGVPIPVWYPLNEHGEPDCDSPILPDEATLPVDPSSDAPAGYADDQRGRPNGFVAEVDVMDTWATSSLTPQIAAGWGQDEDLFARVFPMDLRPQAHEIIRTWLFSTTLRSHLEHDQLPWRHAAISGWILDPDRKKMSKSVGNVVTPMDLLVKHGSDGVRYWAAKGRPGTDTAFDEGMMKVGRRLSIKILNASKFVLGIIAGDDHDPAKITVPLDQAMISRLTSVADSATSALDNYDYTRALESIEEFFWFFCDNYLELVKLRAYGTDDPDDPDGAASARAALALALETQLRLFAPFLPFVTEEIWSWWREGSIHRAVWPQASELAARVAKFDPKALDVAAFVIGEIRKTKSQAHLSMRSEVARVVVRGTNAEHAKISLDDLRRAGSVQEFEFVSADDQDLVVDVSL